MHKKIIFRLAWRDGWYVFLYMRMVYKLVIAQMMLHILLYLFSFLFFSTCTHINNLPEMCWLCVCYVFSSLVLLRFFRIFIYLYIFFLFCIEFSPVGLVGSTNGGVERAHTE